MLQNNVFRFGEQLYRQTKGTAMGTPMAVNYANIFLDQFERDILNEYQVKTGLRPLIWMRYIDDIFLIWSHDKTSLKDFIQFCNNYSVLKNMKSKIKFESNISKDSVNFLDVTVKISENKIQTSVYSKPTDAHIYLHSKSCHPHHVIKNIPNGQFIRVRRICSDIKDFDLHAENMKKNFIGRGYDERNLNQVIDHVRKMKRSDLLQDKVRPTKDGNSVLVCTWHPHGINLKTKL